MQSFTPNRNQGGSQQTVAKTRVVTAQEQTVPWKIDGIKQGHCLCIYYDKIMCK